jgi:hypothetical protein
MGVSWPSLPPKISVADEVRPNEQTTSHMAAAHVAALGCQGIVCSYCFLLVIIEIFFSPTLALIRKDCVV